MKGNKSTVPTNFNQVAELAIPYHANQHTTNSQGHVINRETPMLCGHRYFRRQRSSANEQARLLWLRTHVLETVSEEHRLTLLAWCHGKVAVRRKEPLTQRIPSTHDDNIPEWTFSANSKYAKTYAPVCGSNPPSFVSFIE